MQHTGHYKATVDIDKSIKFWNSAQRFAVLWAQCLQTRSFLQYSQSRDFKYAFGKDVTQRKRLESDVASQRDTTRKGKAITERKPVQRHDEQQYNIDPPFVPTPGHFCTSHVYRNAQHAVVAWKRRGRRQVH